LSKLEIMRCAAGPTRRPELSCKTKRKEHERQR
jgi:hypothetical protein